MSNNDLHKTEYVGYLKITIFLLVMTALNITLAGLGNSNLISGLIIVCAAIQASVTLIWFMHLDLDSRLMRIFVAGVFLLFIIVIVITFFDYRNR